eukprot:1303047-Rhodomonas_salina.1
MHWDDSVQMHCDDSTQLCVLTRNPMVAGSGCKGSHGWSCSRPSTTSPTFRASTTPTMVSRPFPANRLGFLDLGRAEMGL